MCHANQEKNLDHEDEKTGRPNNHLEDAGKTQAGDSSICKEARYLHGACAESGSNGVHAGTSVIVLRIPEASPSLNAFFHKHWRVEHTEKKRWESMLFAASYAVNAPKATGRRRVQIDRFGSRMLDHDNFVGGLKGCIDSLRKLGLLIDDDEAHLELACRQCRLIKGDTPHTIIRIEDL